MVLTILKTNEYVQVAIISVCVVLLIIAYGTYRCTTSSFTDPLTKSIFPPPLNMYFDGWGISHFSMFFVLGYVYPEKVLYSWTLGMIWELFEYSVKDRPFYLTECTYVMDTDHGAGWWYGRWQDVVMNTMGVVCGYVFRKKT